MTAPQPDPAAWALALAGLAGLALLAGLAPRPLLIETAGEPVAWRGGLAPAGVSLGIGLAVLAAAAPFAAWPTAIALALAAVLLASVFLFDLRAMLIPDLYVVLLLVLALVGPLAVSWPMWAIGGGIGGGLLWGVRALYRHMRGVDGLGLGDVKLMAALGALAGPERVLWIIVAGAVLGVAWILVSTRGRPDAAVAIPFGAAAAAPALAVLALGALGR